TRYDRDQASWRAGSDAAGKTGDAPSDHGGWQTAEPENSRPCRCLGNAQPGSWTTSLDQFVIEVLERGATVAVGSLHGRADGEGGGSILRADEDVAECLAFAPDVVDHRMIRGSAGIEPADVPPPHGSRHHLEDQQYAGRIATERLVVCGLEQPCLAAGPDAERHRDRSTVEDQFPEQEIAAIRVQLQRLLIECLVLAAAGDRRTCPALPSARFQCGKGGQPLARVVAGMPLDALETTGFREPAAQPPVFLAPFPRLVGVEVVVDAFGHRE